MKNTFTILLMLLSVSAFGQLSFSWEEDSVLLDRDFEIDIFDLASEGFDTDGDMVADSTAYYAANHLLNESAETEFHWQFNAIAPDEWIVQMCDEDLCYPAWTTDNDVSIPTGYNYEFHYQIRPNGVSGAAVVTMTLWPLSDDTDVRTAYFSVVGNLIDDTGIFELDLVEIQVYPNPTAESLSIETGGNTLFHSSSIYNLGGQEVLHSNITEGTLDVSHLEPGNYILKLNDANGTALAVSNFMKK